MTQGLFVIKNGKAVDLSLDSIFDVKYTHLLALTYSVDEGFLSQHMGHFEDVKLVVGIQDYFVQERAVTGMSASVRQALNYTISNELFENVNFFDSLSNENKLRLQNRSVEIKVPIGCSIHSKLYLLYNDTECRIIIGSANLLNEIRNVKMYMIF